MKKIGNALSVIWRGVYFFLAGIWFLVLYPFFLLGFLYEKNGRYPLVFLTLKVWRTLIAFTSVFPNVIYAGKKYEPKQNYVICGNHTAFMDIVMIYFAYTDYMHCMGKAELLKVPLFNILFKKMNIAVDRKSIVGSHKSLQRATDDLKKGISIAMFPEGTISRKAPKMIPFKNGAFKMAIDNQVPILPITFVNNYHLFPNSIVDGWGGRPGIAKIIVHEPIPTVGMKTEEDIENLKNRTFRIIEDCLKKEYKNYESL